MTPFSIIDFWRIRRKNAGLKTIVRPCHNVKAEVLTDCMLGRIPTPNLMILEPPRVGKTDLTRAFEECSLSYFPDSEFINTSYSDDLAVSTTKAIRHTLTTQWYRDCTTKDFGATVAMRGSLAGGRSDYFHTLQGGCVKGVGVGGGITGFGAGKLRRSFGGAIMIDDPMKAQDKDSPVVRKSIVDWYHGTLESRRNRKEDPMTPIILIMQRLHPQDLAGHLLSTERHRWTVVQIPAHDEQAESIWPARISMEELMHMKEYGIDTYLAQYMQNPSNVAYELIVADWFRFWTNRAEVEKRITLKFITADTAFKEDDSNDYSVLQCWGMLSTQGLVLLDSIKGKWDFPDLCKEAKDFLAKHRKVPAGWTPVTECWVEDRASGTSLVQTLRKAGLPFRQWLPPHADQKLIDGSQVLSGPDKVSRVKQSSMTIKPGRVYLPYPGMDDFRWVENFVNECTAFSNDDSHLYDDQVDTMTMANLIWQQRGGGVGAIPMLSSVVWQEWLQRGEVIWRRAA